MRELDLERDVLVGRDGDELVLQRLSRPDAMVRLSIPDNPEIEDFVSAVVPATPNRRAAFRVPILMPSELQVTLAFGGRKRPVGAANISLIGVLVEVRPEELPELLPGTEVGLTVQLASTSVSLQGVVFHLESYACGIQFTDVWRGDDLRPPTELRRIVAELQRTWLDTRIEE